jgi:hypothetical protein
MQAKILAHTLRIYKNRMQPALETNLTVHFPE